MLVILVETGLLLIICRSFKHAIISLGIAELIADFVYSLVWYSCIIHVSCIICVTLLEDELLVS